MRIEKCLSLIERASFLSHLISKYLWQILNVPDIIFPNKFSLKAFSIKKIVNTFHYRNELESLALREN